MISKRALLGDQPPPSWYGWTVKLVLSIAVLLLGVSLTLLLLTAKSNSDVIHSLAQATAHEKLQDACYDRFTSGITDGNAESLAGLAAALSAQGDLIVVLSAPPPRDQARVDADVVAIGVASQRSRNAVAAYDAATRARSDWVAAGRKLPCPLLD